MRVRARRLLVGSLLALAAAALAAGCGGGGSSSAGSDQGSVALSVGMVSSPATISTVPPAQGRYFLEIQVTLQDVATPSPVPAAFAYFTLATANGLVLSPSATSSAVDMPCAADTSLASGAQFTCNVVFEVPSQESPALLSYDDQHGHTATAPVSYTAPPPSSTCMTLTTWKNTKSSACMACEQGTCQGPFNAFDMELTDGHTCPSALNCGSMCQMGSSTYCTCFEACLGACQPAFDAYAQCVVDQCSASCM